jgi:hypothetical protein
VICGLLVLAFCFSGCAASGLYSVNMYYDAKQAVIPYYLKADYKTSNVAISLAEFTDSRRMDDRLVIGHVVEQNGTKVLVFPKKIKATKAISGGIEKYLKKAGYKVNDRTEQWDLKEETIPQASGKVIIGGNIEELEIFCQRGLPINSYNAHIKFTFVIADAEKRKILYQKRMETSYSQEHVLFSEEHLADLAGIVMGDAIEKLFEERIVAQKLKEAVTP